MGSELPRKLKVHLYWSAVCAILVFAFAALGFTFGGMNGRSKAMRDSAPVWVAAIYDPQARQVFAELGHRHAHEQITKVDSESGEAERYHIESVVLAGSKMIIETRAVRRGVQYDEVVLVISGRFADFSSEPAD